MSLSAIIAGILHNGGTGTPARRAPRYVIPADGAPPPSRDTATIGPQNRITLATLAAILAVGIPLLWQVWELRRAVEGVWTVRDQERYIAECQARNPGLMLPTTLDILSRRLPGD